MPLHDNTMCKNDVMKWKKVRKCVDEILLNLKIKLSNLSVTLRLKS